MPDKKGDGEVSIVITTADQTFLSPMNYESRRSTGNTDDLKDYMALQPSPRHSNIVALHRPSVLTTQRKFILDLFASRHGSTKSLNAPVNEIRANYVASVKRMQNRRFGK
jgi:hypothetical protein